MYKYLYLIFFVILFGCGKNNEPSNDELLAEAVKTSPWIKEDVINIATDEERKAVVLFIDTLLLDLEKPNTFNKTLIEKHSKVISTRTTNDFDLTHTSSLGGFINWKGQLTQSYYSDLESEDSTFFFDETNSTYKFYSFISTNYSINGILKLNKEEDRGSFGNYSIVKVIDGGISYKSSDGIRNVALHIELNFERTSVITKNFTAIVNGVAIEGDLDIE